MTDEIKAETDRYGYPQTERTKRISDLEKRHR